jgi:4'-phosphopantetheinyl transferase
MVDVYWLEQTEGDVPAENDWLSANETLCLNSMRFPKRRTDWRLGRWTAKRALAICLTRPTHPEALAGIEILASRSGAPEVVLTGQPAAVTISLSHRGGAAVCAVALSGAALGCDLELIEPRSDCFVADYFTTEEQAFVAGAAAADRFRRLALLWSGKESTLKALHEGLRLDARCVQAIPLDEQFTEASAKGGCHVSPASTRPSSNDFTGWHPLQVRYRLGAVFSGWWQQSASLVRTIVSIPAPNPPIPLQPSI